MFPLACCAAKSAVAVQIEPAVDESLRLEHHVDLTNGKCSALPSRNGSVPCGQERCFLLDLDVTDDHPDGVPVWTVILASGTVVLCCAVRCKVFKHLLLQAMALFAAFCAAAPVSASASVNVSPHTLL